MTDGAAASDDFRRPRWRRAFQVQGRVLAALVLREAETRRGRAFALSYVAAAVEPLLIVGVIVALFGLISRQPIYGTSTALFVGTGVFPVYVFLLTSVRVREPISSAQLGRYPAERPLDEVLAHALLHLLSTGAVAVAFFAGLHAFGVEQARPFDVGGAVTALLVLFAFGVSMGLFNSVVGRLLPLWDTLWPGLVRVLLHFSGIYYLADNLPPHVRGWFELNPLLHGVNWFRQSFYPFYPDIIDEPAYLLLWVLAAAALGLSLERVARRMLARRS